MKKEWYFFALYLASLFCFVPNAQAVISDPEDHVFYYSGLLGPTREYVAPDFMGGSGWSYGSTGTVLNSNRTLYEYLGVESTDTVYALILNKNTGAMALHLPYCDSIFVEFWGTGQRGIKISNDKNDLYGWSAKEGNRPVSVGARFREKDSVTVYLTPTKLEMGVQPTGDVFISSIKIYGPIGDGEVPEFDGNIAAWTFQYRPQESGTVDLNEQLTTTGGWEETVYPMYASDLGVVRAKLTTSTEGMVLGYDDNFGTYAAKIENLGVTNAGDYSNGETHGNYFQLQVSDKGFQDVSLQFDFTLLDGSDTCVVAYLLKDSLTWQVAGKYLKNEEAWSKMTSVNLPLTELTDKGDITFRIIMGNGDYSDGAGMVLSKLALKGYDDYYESSKNAVKVAYITNATDRVHILKRAVSADSLDMRILPALFADTAYRVTVIAQDTWKTLTQENIVAAFSEYDLVVLSNFPKAESNIVDACKALVGKKPFLNFNQDAYGNTCWNWAEVGNAQPDSKAVYENSFRFHPLFNGIRIENTDSLLSLFDTMESSGLQGFSTSSYKGPESSYTMASPLHSPQLTCFHELNANPEAKYMLLAISEDAYPFVSEAGVKMVKNAIDYLASSSMFIAPDFNMISIGAEVKNLSELKAAMAYDYTSLRLNEVQILLSDCQDEGGVYQLGESGWEMHPWGRWSLKAASGSQPVLSGNILSTGGMRVNKLSFEGLVFEGKENDSKALIPIQASDTIVEEIALISCTLNGLTQSLLSASSADKAMIGSVRIENCSINGFGGNNSSEGPAFIDFGTGTSCVTSIALEENTLKDYHGKQLIKMQNDMSTSSDTLIHLSVEHNTFFDYSGTASEDANLIEWKENPHLPATINVNNNLFYGRYAQGGVYSRLALYESTQPSTLNVLNNYADCDLAVVSGNFTIQRNDLTAETLGLESVFVDNLSVQISKISPLYVAGTQRSHVGAKSCYINRTQASTLRVSNVPELITAFEITIEGDSIVLENCDAPEGVYLLGSAGMVYPQHFGNLVIGSAEGHSPKLFGRLSSSNGCKLNNLTIYGLNFIDQVDFEGYDKEVYAPFYVNVCDSILGTLMFKDCSFRDFENQQIFRTNKGCSGMLIGSLEYDHCLFDNMGGSKPINGKAYGAHFIQFENSSAYQLDRFVFTNNTVENFHGSQFFNISRQYSTSTDSLIEIIIENNLFYRLGGHADKNRNFLEFNKQPIGFDVNIEINNNIFYQRLSSDYYPTTYLSLFDQDSSQVVNVHVKNNFFDGEYYNSDETFGDNPMAPKDEMTNLKAIGANETLTTNIKVDYTEPITRSSLGIQEVFTQESPIFSIAQTSPLFIAGTDGKYIGPWNCYYAMKPNPICSPSASMNQLQVYVAHGELYLMATQAIPVEIYDLMGRLVRSQSLEEGLNRIEGVQAGLYLVKAGAQTIKAMIPRY